MTQTITDSAARPFGRAFIFPGRDSCAHAHGSLPFTCAPVSRLLFPLPPQRVKARFLDKSTAPRKASSWRTGVAPGMSRTPQKGLVVVSRLYRVSAIYIYVVQELRAHCRVKLVDVGHRHRPRAIPRLHVSQVRQVPHIRLFPVYAVVE